MTRFETPKGYKYAYLMHSDGKTRVLVYRRASITNDNPIRYRSGLTAYDAPESVGKTAKAEVQRLMNKLKREGRQAFNDLTP